MNDEAYFYLKRVTHKILDIGRQQIHVKFTDNHFTHRSNDLAREVSQGNYLHLCLKGEHHTYFFSN